MDCTDCRAALHPYVDGELPPEARGAMAAHLAGCANCRELVDEATAWQRAVRRHATRYQAPESLRRELRAMQGAARRPSPVLAWRGMAMAASLVLAVALSSAMTAYLVAPPSDSGLVQDLVSDHVRSLMADHLTDVVSSDQHTVKPWFLGRLDYAPPVDDPAQQSFPLVGGRLDYLGNRPVAALVYRHEKHPINVFVFPSDEPSGISQHLTRSGYNILHWTADGMAYWAVSDLNAAELKDFEKAFIQRRG